MLQEQVAGKARLNAILLAAVTGLTPEQIVEFAEWHVKWGVDLNYGFQLLKWGREARV